MTDYIEEQRNEMEALESIYPDELQILSQEPAISFSLDIKTNACSDNYMSTALKFTYVPKYPDTVPLIEIIDPENFSDDDVDELLQFLEKRAEENVGMAMVFTLVSEASEWLNERLATTLARRKEDEELRLQKLEEEERLRMEGHRVTVESFMAWKLQFDREMMELKRPNMKDETSTKKLTGRELFEKDQSLVDSDLQFLQDGEEVKVDESLFQDLDDLELQEEELSS